VFRINVSKRPSVAASYSSLSPKVKRQVEKRIDRLRRRGPDSPGVEKLKGVDPPRYRDRTGDYRIIFEVHGRELDILEIVNRKDAYR
jgi:mRNA-degrading endonuclease RelE of RelBE toxin-antitoxin system